MTTIDSDWWTYQKNNRLLLLADSMNDVMLSTASKFQEYSDWPAKHQHGLHTRMHRCVVLTTHVCSPCWKKSIARQCFFNMAHVYGWRSQAPVHTTREHRLCSRSVFTGEKTPINTGHIPWVICIGLRPTDGHRCRPRWVSKETALWCLRLWHSLSRPSFQCHSHPAQVSHYLATHRDKPSDSSDDHGTTTQQVKECQL